jgi:DNA-binding transcriptional regulator LsrR (DeoR family)
MSSKVTTEIQKIANCKGWTLQEVANRWGISERQMSRVAAAAKQRDIDAANGLPHKK